MKARRLAIGVYGNTFWAQRLVQWLNRAQESHIDARLFSPDGQVKAEEDELPHPVSAGARWQPDIVHFVGSPRPWRPMLWAWLRSTPVVVHWIGSDVSWLSNNPRRRVITGAVLRLVCRLHLAVSEALVEELRSFGICAERLPLLSEFYDRVEISPLPDVPRVLAYLPANRFEFYGGPAILRMASQTPEIEWWVVGNDGQGFPALPNLRWLGYVKDMASVYRQVAVLVRITRHDGLPCCILEALARGRHVVWSFPMPHCRRARTAEVALKEVRDALACGNLNQGGAQYVRREYDALKQARRLYEMYASLLGRGHSGAAERGQT